MSHVARVTSSCFYQRRRLRQIRRPVGQELQRRPTRSSAVDFRLTNEWSRDSTQKDSPPLLALSSRQFHSKLKNVPLSPIISSLFFFHIFMSILWSVDLAQLSFSSHCHLHPRHSPPPHSFMPVSVNKPPTDIAVWQALYRHFNLPTHLHSLFYSLWGNN